MQIFLRDFKKAKFHLVDLAGSERAKKTCASGERLKEGKKSLRPTIYLIFRPVLMQFIFWILFLRKATL